MMNEKTVEGFRLSPQQKHIWLLQRSAQPAPYYAQAVIELAGRLDPEALRVAAREVCRTHEILRTTFHNLPGMQTPVQVVGDGDDSPAFAEHDLCGLDAAAQAEIVESLGRDAARQTFDFARGPLVRLVLATLAADRHTLIVTLPSLCADAGTLNLFARELSRAYAAHLEGDAFGEPPLQYVDFAEWRNELMESADADLGKTHWAQQHCPTAASLALPFERATGARGEFEPRVLSLVLSQTAAGRIAAAAERCGVSEQAFLLTCWAALLARVTGQSDIVVATACDGRKYEQLGAAFGPFVRHLPVRCQLDEAQPLADALARVEEQTRAAYTWQEYFDPARETDGDNHAPLPFCFEHAVWPDEQHAAGLTFSVARLYACFDRFRLKLCCRRRGPSLITEFHYDRAAFDAQAVARLAAQYHALLDNAVGADANTLGALAYVGPVERHQLLVEFNDTATRPTEAAALHRLFEQQVARTPDRVALVFEDEQLTYAGLNRYANRLARRLRKLGIGPEAPVAIYAERVPDTLVAMLAVLKAGGAFVPLDTAQPRARLAAQVAQLGEPLLLGRAQALGTTAAGARVVYLGADRPEIAAESSANLDGGAGGGNLAYVLFTSGSTGNPKAVAVEHRQLLNYVAGINARLELPDGASVAVASTLAADLGYTGIFPTLCAGGRLHLLAAERTTDAEAMTTYFLRRQIDAMKIVPGHFDALCGADRARALMPQLRLVLGGEACGWEFVESLQAAAPDSTIFNHYGPTETTVGVLTYRVAPRATDGATTNNVPLGFPLSNSRVYVVNDSFDLAPAGAVGEVYIGGTGVARGYAQRPDLTAERFLPDPFAAAPGARVYKTGDVARFTPAGAIEFLGRADHQVKVRGFRVELGEIEAVLRRHSSVREAVVTARATGRRAHDKYLAAYVVARAAAPASERELREWLRAALPDYMMPAAFVFLSELPRTPNGKVDRNALPAPEVADASDDAFVAPCNPVEEALAEIWTEVLERECVGAHDDFFRLGGDSLLAIRVTSRVRKIFRVEMLPRHLFESPTVAGLARLLARHEAQPGRLAAIARLRKQINALPEGELQATLGRQSGAQGLGAD
jgi:amino acid adenylation domain-containing protein